MTKRDELLSFASRYGRMPVIQLLVLRNRRQWLLTAILRSGYVKKFVSWFGSFFSVRFECVSDLIRSDQATKKPCSISGSRATILRISSVL